MKCARCGRANPGASWYCVNCGAALEDLNVADSGRRRPLPAILRWSLALVAASLALLAALALGAFALRYVRHPETGTGTGVAGSQAGTTSTAEVGGAGTAAETGGATEAGANRTGASPAGPGTRAARQGGAGATSGPGGARSAQGGAGPTSGPGGGTSAQGGAGLTAETGGATSAQGGAGPTSEPDTEAATAGAPRIVTEPPAAGATAAPTPFIRTDTPVWRIGRLARPPLLDGRLDDWSGSPIDVLAVVFGGEYWTGPDDLSARAHAGWDDQALYLGVQVIDDIVSQPSTGSRLYLGDSLEVQLDVDLPGDAIVGRYDADDWQIGLSPGDFGGRSPEVHVWRPEERNAPEVTSSARRLENGYILEARLPWSYLGFDPEPGRSLGMALNVSDNDDPRPAQLTMISMAPRRSWGDPRTFATLVLEE